MGLPPNHHPCQMGLSMKSTIQQTWGIPISGNPHITVKDQSVKFVPVSMILPRVTLCEVENMA